MKHSPSRLAPLLALVLLLCPLMGLRAQLPRFYSLEEGLLSSRVNTLCVDSDNLVWIATNETLEMFDGLRFHAVDVRDASGALLFNDVRCMLPLDAHRFLLATNYGLHLLDKRTNAICRVVLSDGEPPSGYAISGLAWDAAHTHLYVATEGFRAYVLDAATLRPDSLLTRRLSHLLPAPFIQMLRVDSHGRLWVATRSAMPVVVDMREGRVLTLDITPEARQLLQQSSVVDMAEWVQGGRVYLALSRGGLLVCDTRPGGRLRPSLHPEAQLFMQSLHIDRQGRLLVGTDNRGLWQMDLRTERLTPLTVSLANTDMQYAKVHDIEEDPDGNLLVALYQRGLLVLPRASASFHHLPLSPHHTAAADPWNVVRNASCVTSFAQDADGHLLAGTDGCGLFSIAPDGSYATLGTDNQTLLTQSVAVDRTGRVWAGIWRGGLQTLTDGRLQTPDVAQPLAGKDVMRLSYDACGHRLYAMCNGDGVWCLDLAQGTCTRLVMPTNLLEWGNHLLCDSRGRLWVADMDTVFNVDATHRRLTAVRDAQGAILPVTTQMVEDPASPGRLLAATTQGVHCIDGATCRSSQPQWLRCTNGLNVLSLVATPTHVWLATNHALHAVDRRTGRMTTFNSFGGNRVGAFHRCAAIMADAGLMVFGSDNGLLAFSPTQLLQRPQGVRQVHFTALRIGSDDVVYDAADAHCPLDQSILTATSVSLPRGGHALTAFFSAPELADPTRVVYAYRLEGYEKDWHTTTWDNAQAYYANLQAGNYRLRVRASFEDQPDTLATEAVLDVHVPAQLWATWWARLIYMALALLAAWFVWSHYRGRRIAHERLRESRHATQTKEAQLRLFTSIAHELRSPLTMIVSPLEELMARPNDAQTTENYQIMQRNCQRMLRVVNQITDVRRIDSGQLRLHCRPVDLVAYASSLATAFKGAAMARGVSLLTECDAHAPTVWLDPINAEKIVVNLLSNAMKFTPQGGRVIVRVMRRQTDVGDRAELTVYNSGSHIAEADLGHVFERFYQGSTPQARSGSGIGLNLARQIATLHHGTLTVRNLEPDGVEFVLRLPMGADHLTEDEKRPDEATQAYEVAPLAAAAQEEPQATLQEEPQVTAQQAAPTRRTTVLLVDDDKELLAYMASQLQAADYDVTTAPSGNRGWQLVLSQRPDVVVTDIKMPDGDGFGLLRRIKQNPETDLTAVIVLTTEADARSHLQAMDLQAEHFLPKPFNAQMLLSALSLVTRLREQLRQRMRRTQMTVEYDAPTGDAADQRLMKRVRQSIVDHLSDSDFNVEVLAQEAGLSRAHLNRKLKQLCGISPSSYIRSVRLKQAARLLATKQVNVSEAAYTVGFSSHSYFSSNFHDFFGMTPREFVAFYSDADNEEALRKLLE